MNPRDRAVVAAAFVTQAAAIGSTMGVMALLLRPVSEDLGGTLAQASLGPSLIILSLALAGFGVGVLFDRRSIRDLMLGAAVCHAALVALASQATAMWQLGVVCALLGLLTPALGPLASSVLVGKAVHGERGRALGVANMGVAAGSVVFATLAGFTLEAWGWRGSLLIFAALSFCLMLPSIWFGIPRELPSAAATPSAAGTPSAAATPSAAGTDGEMQAAGEAAPPPVAWTAATLVRSRAFMAGGLAFGLAMGTMGGWGPHLANFVHSIGGARGHEAFAVAAGGALTAPGTLLYGALGDRFGHQAVLRFIIVTLALGFALLMTGPAVVAALAIVSLMALGIGGMLPVYAALLTDRFGQASLGRVMGLSNLFMLPLGFGGSPLAGALFDAQGSYASVLGIFCGLQVLALVVSSFSGPDHSD